MSRLFHAPLSHCLPITKSCLLKKTEEARDGLKEPPSGQFDWYYLSKLTFVLFLPHALLENRLFQFSLNNSFSSSSFEARNEEERLDVRAEVVGFSLKILWIRRVSGWVVRPAGYRCFDLDWTPNPDTST